MIPSAPPSVMTSTCYVRLDTVRGLFQQPNLTWVLTTDDIPAPQVLSEGDGQAVHLGLTMMRQGAHTQPIAPPVEQEYVPETEPVIDDFERLQAEYQQRQMQAAQQQAQQVQQAVPPLPVQQLPGGAAVTPPPQPTASQPALPIPPMTADAQFGPSGVNYGTNDFPNTPE
ncbi:MAG: hypothetical protein AAGF99_00390 [Bacteroidota bacterium]